MKAAVKVAGAIVLSVAAYAVLSRGFHYAGEVLDGAAGEPAADVIVIGVWQLDGGFVVSKSGCVVDVTKSDANGRFKLSRSRRLTDFVFEHDPDPNVHFYRRGYAWVTDLTQRGQPYAMKPEHRSSESLFPYDWAILRGGLLAFLGGSV